jgi:hypothetical protein
MHGRRLLALGDAQHLLVASINPLHAIPDIALLLAALGLLAVDDEPDGQAVVVDRGAARIAGEGRTRGQLSRARHAELACGKGPAVRGVVLADSVGAVEERGDGLDGEGHGCALGLMRVIAGQDAWGQPRRVMPMSVSHASK